ncbi:MAG: hypothetical protein EOO61_10040 [Hymenobacter sp.]|nr:MAG: hypothetical protein EOO61_10040 [Hymenobacter sp.]
MTYQLSNISASWPDCEKWMMKQDPLDSLEILSNALAAYSQNWMSDSNTNYDPSVISKTNDSQSSVYTTEKCPNEDYIAELLEKIKNCQTKLSETELKSDHQQETIVAHEQKLKEALKLVQEQQTSITNERENNAYWVARGGGRSRYR